MKLWLASPVASDIPDEVFQPITWEKAATEQIRDFQQSSVYGPLYNRISPPKNMILFIGDGMSSSTITGASANRMTTDSAAAATALVCGSKVAQSVIGLSGVKECCICEPSDSAQKLQSILIQAHKKGLSVGIVTTTRITHATPAATYAHSTDRNQENKPKVSSSNSSFVCDDIASQLIDKGLDFKVILGGGAKHFYQNVSEVTPKTPGSRTDGKNLFKQWLSEQRKRNRRHALVFHPYELRRLNLDKVDYLFGLLAPSHLDYEIRRTDQPSLSEMTQIAVKILSRNPKGYLLLVESGRIDHGHHTNQAKYALTETLALERAVNTTIGLVNIDETLVLVTADHSHGYGVIGYANRRTHILGLDDSQLADDGHPYLISNYFSGPGASSGKPRGNPSIGRTFENGYRQQALIPLRRGVHAADDVPLYATGPFNQLFHRPVDNTFVAYATIIVSPSDSSFICDDIASQLIHNGLDFNVILGGGSRMFYQNVTAVTPKTLGSRKDGKNLFEQWLREQQKRNRKHKLIFDSEKLKRLDLAEVDYLFGLLAPNHLDYEIHRTDQLSLSELTQIAVQILSKNPKGYLLLVEGGRIDHGHHSNQAKYALTETLALEQAVSSAMSQVNLNETLMLVTADHSHAYGVVGEANRRRHILDLDNSQLANDGYPYLISAYFNGPAGSVKEPRRDPSTDRIFQDDYRQQALVPLSSATHAADDVPLYATGPLSQLFHRSVDNTYVAHATMFALCLEQYKQEPHCTRRNISPNRDTSCEWSYGTPQANRLADSMEHVIPKRVKYGIDLKDSMPAECEI
ncbi:hypothetical protein EG68_01600 [Paragonimus skrjabini miyazakii]|uniref:alkaline phosphatase n=1 Tax=Paragonimus skrjabini miyazakii TaxID=59628 RepID=A0A8S9Z686_9TREM|nr:hypothetical protein EG68_01600 [Paragonimus skrjabini miyazakii]